MYTSTDNNNDLIEARIMTGNHDSRSIALSGHKRNTRVPWNLAVAFPLVWLFGCTTEFSLKTTEVEDSETSTAEDDDSAISSVNDSGEDSLDTEGTDSSTEYDTEKDTESESDIIGEDQCPLDPNKTEPGFCGCGVLDMDEDKDGTPDCRDDCPDDSSKTKPGNCGCGVDETCGDWTWIYEAEDRTSDHDASFSSGNSGYLGSGYMDYGGSGSYVEWNNVALPAAGSYTLDFRYASSYYGRPARLFVGGVEKAGIPFSAGFPSWSDWRVNTVTVTIPAGTNTIRVVAIDTGPNLDRMTITWAGGQ